MTTPTTILIVDDHEVVRKGVRSYLETVPDFQVVGEASSGENIDESQLIVKGDIVI